MTILAIIHLPSKLVSCEAFVDFGATGIFLDYTFAKENNIPFVRKSRPLNITTLNGQPLGDGIVKFETTTMTVQVGLFHKEEVVLSLIDSPLLPIILGYPWLQQYNPSFDWENGELTSSPS